MSDERENRWGGSPGSHLFFAGFLIVAGTLLFLGNLGVLPVQTIWSYWPLLIVGLGMLKISNASDLSQRMLGILIACFGVVFLLISLGVIRIHSRDHSWPISMLLIAFGLAMLIRVLDKREPGRPVWSGFLRPPAGDAATTLRDVCVLSEIKRRVNAADFRGGNALTILGNIELDFRHANAQPGQTIHLEVSAILGAAKIRVPDYWRTRIHGSSVLGSYEDKTVPSNAGPDAPTLVLTGYSVLGSVEIED
jgi:hypothetical protein